MAISRRDVLLRGSTIGVGIIAANVPDLVATSARPLAESKGARLELGGAEIK